MPKDERRPQAVPVALFNERRNCSLCAIRKVLGIRRFWAARERPDLEGAGLDPENGPLTGNAIRMSHQRARVRARQVLDKEALLDHICLICSSSPCTNKTDLVPIP